MPHHLVINVIGFEDPNESPQIMTSQSFPSRNPSPIPTNSKAKGAGTSCAYLSTHTCGVSTDMCYTCSENRWRNATPKGWAFANQD